MVTKQTLAQRWIFIVVISAAIGVGLAIFVAPHAHADETILMPKTSTEANVANPSSLYIYLAGGSALTNPDSSFNQTANDFTSQGGRVNIVGVIEGGVYRKHDDHLWLGILPSLVAEEFSSNYQQTTSLALNHWNLDASAWWFFHPRTSCGFNTRLDAGYTYVHEYYSINNVSSDAFHNGIAGKISVGYALPIFNNGDFWSFNLGGFGTTAGSFSETGIDITVGVML